MAVPSAEGLRAQLERLASRPGRVGDFSHGAARALARSVPFDGFCTITIDPASTVPTGEVVENGLPPEATARMAAIEVGGGDFNTFTGLAESDARAAGLGAATGGQLDRSLRHRELRKPHGLGDELRVALMVESTLWGGLTLLRSAERDPFSAAEIALVASLAETIGTGLRDAILPSRPPLAPAAAEMAEMAGILLLDRDDEILQADPLAAHWLAELRDRGGALPQAVVGVASRARRNIDAGVPAKGPVSAQVCTPSGTWLTVRASALEAGPAAPTAIVIEPARPRRLASLVADARGLTEGERAVTRLVARGLPTATIAAQLHISPWTVQDHLKSIFEKLDVSSRGELVARLFVDPVDHL